MSDNLPQGYINVVISLNPFSEDDRAVAVLPVGHSIKDIFDLYASNAEGIPEEQFSAFIDGDYVFPDLWDKVKPKSGSSVYIKAVPGALAALGVLAPIAGKAVAGFLGLTAGKLAYSLVSAAVAFGVLAIGQALFAPSEPEPLPEKKTVYTISGARNRMNQWGPVPSILGRHRFVPSYGAVPYTRAFGDDQYLYLVLVWGYGPVRVQDIRIGNTPIGNYSDVTAWHDFTGNQLEIPLYPRDVSQEIPDAELVTSPGIVRTTPPNTNQAVLEFTAPNGLYTAYKNKVKNSAPVAYSIYYREIGDTNWILALSRVIPGPNVSLVRISETINFPYRGEWDVRVDRNPKIPDNPDPNVTIRQDAFWSSLTSFDLSSRPINLPGVAKSAYIIRATDQIGDAIEEINGVVTSIIPIWNGSNWNTSAPSSNPAAIFRHVLRGSQSPKPVTNTNDSALADWYNFCYNRGLTFNRVIDFRIPVPDLLKDIAAAGMATPAYVDDKWTVTIDRPQTNIIQHFSPRNTSNFQGALLFNDYPEALRVRFNNQDEDFLEDEFIVYDDGFNSSNTTKYQNVVFPGVTDYRNIWRLGRYFIAAQKLRPEFFTFDIDIENLVATSGDLCRLTHDSALIGQTSGRVSAINSSEITLDEEVFVQSGFRYTIRVRKADGVSVVQNFVSSSTGNKKVIPLGGYLLNQGVQPGDLFLFGEEHLESREVVIADIEYLDDLSARVRCVPYDAELYNPNVIPDFESGISDLNSVTFRGPPRPIITSVVTDESALLRLESGLFQPRILLYLKPGSPSVISQSNTTVTQSYLVRYREVSTSTWIWVPVTPSNTPFIPLSSVRSGVTYEVQVQAVDGTGGKSPWATKNVFVTGGTNPPSDVSALYVNTTGAFVQISWTPVTDVDLSHYEIRFTEDLITPTWVKSVIVADRVSAQTTTTILPVKKGTYFIKAVDAFGNKSINATSNVVQSNLDEVFDVELVNTTFEHPTFAGNKDSVVVDGGNLVLDGSLDPLPLRGVYDFEDVVDLEHVYTFYVTSIVDFDQSSLTNTFDDATGLFDSRFGLFDGDESLFDLSNVRVQISTTRDDPNSSPEWSQWSDFVTTEVTARGLRFRAILETDDTDIAPKLNELGVRLEIPVSFRSGEDINFTGSTSVSFSTPFWKFSVPAVGVSLTGLSPGDYYTISNKTHTGFTIEVRDSGGSLKNTATQLDYVAKGYGKEI